MEKINPQKETQLYIICAESRKKLVEKLGKLQEHLNRQDVTSFDTANLLNSSIKKDGECLSVICSSAQELKKKLVYASKKLVDINCRRIYERSGIYYFQEKLAQEGQTAFLFPGEGSQYQNMLAELSLYFPEVRRGFEIADSACSLEDGFLPSQYIFPTEIRDGEFEEGLWKMEGAVEAVLGANYGMTALLKKLKIKPDCLVGHSSGEFTALEAAGVIQFDDERKRIKFIRDGYVLMKKLSSQKEIPEGILVTVGGVKRKEIESAIKQISSPIFIAMENCFHQYVLCGCRDVIEKVVGILSKEGAICSVLPFNRPYHTSWFERALGPLKDFFDRQKIFPPKIEIYSCAQVALYPADPKKIRSNAVQQWAMPVKFQETIEAMYKKGVRIFVEVGPRGNLTGFVDNILKDKVHIAVPLDKIYHSAITQLNRALGLLAANGVEMELDYFYKRRPLFLLDFRGVKDERKKDKAFSMRLPEMRFRGESGEKLHLFVSESRSKVDALDKEKGSSKQQVLNTYFQTMENFVAFQGEIMRAYLERKIPEKEKEVLEGATASLKSHEFPLLGEISELKPGESLISVREFDVDEDIFLQHHTLGIQISITEPELRALPLIPLTISTEILAEAALALVGKKILIGMKDIVASKWITFEERKVVLEISAKRKVSSNFEEVDVEIRQANGSKDGIRTLRSPMVKGTMVLADAYPVSPAARPSSAKHELKRDFSGSEIYPKRLFHGTIFQAVDSVTHWEEHGLEGMLKVSAPAGLFRSNSNPKFVTDPVLLDAMGQAIGIWAAKEPWNGFILFPFHVKAIHFFKPNLPEGEKVKFQLSIPSTNETMVVANIDLIGKDNKVLARIEGWEDRNFYITKPLHQFFLQPMENTLSLPWALPEQRLLERGKFKFCILEGFPDDFFQHHHKIWEKMLTFLIFNSEKRQRWQSMQGNEKFRIQHLLGMAAAKDVVRLYLSEYHGLKLGPADIIIGNSENGRPFVTGSWMDKVSHVPSLSISHTGMVVVAAAGLSPEKRGIGVDVEDINNLNDILLEAAFSEKEHRLASSINLNTSEWMARFWCAKEAFCKAVGSGMIFSPKDIVVKEIDVKMEKVIMQARRSWIKEFPFLEGKSIEAYTFVRGNLAIAACLS